MLDVDPISAAVNNYGDCVVRYLLRRSEYSDRHRDSHLRNETHQRRPDRIDDPVKGRDTD